MGGRNLLLLRLSAYLIDCALIMIFAIGLGIVSLGLKQVFNFGEITQKPLVHLLAFSTLSLPAILYFAITESGPKAASVGKRIMKLKVCTQDGTAASFRQALLRSVILLLPWEIAHIAIWYGADTPFRDPMSTGGLTVAILAQILVLIYFISAVITPEKAIAERITRLKITRS